MSDDKITLDRLTRTYIKMRDQISEVQNEYDAKIAALKEKKDTIAQAMRDMLKEMGVDSARTPHGTVWLTVKTRYYTADWAEFNKFVKEHDAVDLFERRIHQSNMSQWLKEHPDLIPPGLNADSSYDVSVRKLKA